jgi:hypothetical protein
VAVENGFEGTEAEWLDSLQGPPGNDGVLTERQVFNMLETMKFRAYILTGNIY